MRKLSFKVAFAGYTLPVAAVLLTAGCSFHMGTDPVAPTTPPPAAAPGTPAKAATPAKPVVTLGRTKHPAGSPTAPGTTPTTPAAGIPVQTGASVFGQGTPEVTGWKGSFYVIPVATQKLPGLATMTPNGVLFAKELNVAVTPMTGGFPGIDATRNENFALRWEAPLVVDTESDYTFRIVSDDGSIVAIDGTPIVDNDGAHAVQEKSGPVHLVKGTHGITVDYFQTTGSVALQLFCKKAGGTESVCPTHLP